MNKKFFLVIGMAILSITQLSADWFSIDNIRYTILANSMDVEVSSDGSQKVGDIVIPNIVEHNGQQYNVIGIGERAFSNSNKLNSISIPNSITYIGQKAFDGCSSLTSITIPNSVIKLGNNAFEYCTSLSSVKLSDNLQEIGESVFFYCNSLPTTDGIRYADTYLVEVMDNTMTAYTIKSGTKYIGERSFFNRNNLETVTIPNSVMKICSNAFNNCTNLTRVNILDLSAWCNIQFENNTANPLYNAKHLYLNNNEITDLIIPNSVTNVENYAFINSSITSLTIPSSITSIGTNAFSGCSSLTSVTIPSSIAFIGTNAFSGCSSLATVTWNTKNILDIQNIFTDSSIQTMIIGDEVEVVPANFCKSMSSLTKLVLGKNVRTISSNAFNGCIGLTNIYIPNSVVTIGDNAFSGCNGLTSISISNNVTRIEQNAFSNCSSLTSVTIPISVNSIENSAFYGCTNLTRVNVSDLSAWCNITFDAASSNPLYYAKHLYLNNNEIIDLVIPNSVTSIKANTFINSSITSVKMHNNIENIEKWAFYGCENLSEISIPNSVKKIGDQAFSGCRKMKTIDMGTGVENIGSGAFAYCPYIKDITIKAEYPPVCTYNTFQGCGTEDASGKETFTNINLYVMKSSMSMYQKTSVWKDFNIRPIAAQSTYTDKVTVTPYTNSADISWPAIDDADTYNLTISNNGNMVCRHEFNESGQLMSVVYRMPSATNDAQLTEALGFQYTITDLASGTKYDFNLLIQDKTQKTIKTYTGTFITEGATALEYVHFDGNISDLISQPSTMIFNLQGQNVSNQRDNLAQGTYIVHNDGKAYKILIYH